MLMLSWALLLTQGYFRNFLNIDIGSGCTKCKELPSRLIFLDIQMRLTQVPAMRQTVNAPRMFFIIFECLPVGRLFWKHNKESKCLQHEKLGRLFISIFSNTIGTWPEGLSQLHYSSLWQLCLLSFNTNKRSDRRFWKQVILTINK